jgi:hypothetical protein
MTDHYSNLPSVKAYIWKLHETGDVKWKN